MAYFVSCSTTAAAANNDNNITIVDTNMKRTHVVSLSIIEFGVRVSRGKIWNVGR